jgi:hypothetical protein
MHNGSACSVAERMDEREWLYGGGHRIVFIPRHEGYDVAGSNALVAFLPFKSARLAAIMGQEEYSDYLFIAGRPRLAGNQWRLDALKDINATVTRQWPIVEMSTFSYRTALKQLASPLFDEEGLLHHYDVHLAPMGSKLQTFACWVVSCIAPSITVLTSVPGKYFSNAFSLGIGAQWAFPFVRP